MLLILIKANIFSGDEAMKKRILLTPGPTMVPPQVLLAGAQPIIHHRAPDFEPIQTKVCEDLKYAFQTQNPVIFIASSGTGAMEGAVASLLAPGEKAIAVVAGKFGERWAELCKAFGVNAVVINVPWDKAVEPAQIEQALKENPDTKAVFVTHCETSTGNITDVKAIGAIVSKTDAVLVVDAVSSLGAEELRPDDWGIDVVVTGSQKALMLPPGLAFASISPKAKAKIAATKNNRYYLDFGKYLKGLDKKEPPYTPPVSLMVSLQVALEMIKAEGIENIWARHRKLADAIRAGVLALGLTLYSKNPSNVVCAINVPEGIDGGKIPKIFRDDMGVTIAGGQGDLKGKIFRIATLGYADVFDATTCLAALELTLKKLNYKFEIGTGITATLKVLAG